MQTNFNERVIVFESQARPPAMEARLVLDAAGIESHVQRSTNRWQVIVDETHRGAAIEELREYQRENPVQRKREFVKTHLFGGAGVGVLGYAAIITLMFVASSSPESRETWQSIGRMNAGKVVDGEIWRTVTALMLHADLSHLISNVVYGSLFGFMAGRILGGGVAWLTIVLAAALGNGLNAVLREVDHNSIGASTAVFAALGALVAHALRPTIGLEQTLTQRWTPLIGGVLMLALTGLGGERTDVGAHVCGFVAGLVLGWFAARIPTRFLAKPQVQFITGMIAVAITIVAWWIAIG